MSPIMEFPASSYPLSFLEASKHQVTSLVDHDPLSLFLDSQVLFASPDIPQDFHFGAMSTQHTMTDTLPSMSFKPEPTQPSSPTATPTLEKSMSPPFMQDPSLFPSASWSPAQQPASLAINPLDIFSQSQSTWPYMPQLLLNLHTFSILQQQHQQQQQQQFQSPTITPSSSSPPPTSVTLPAPASPPQDTTHTPSKRRKCLTVKQRTILMALFEQDKSPDSDTLRGITGKVGMTLRQVQYWFQNKRAALRRLRISQGQVVDF